MEYFVTGEVTIEIDMDIKANSLEEAEKKAKEIVEDYYMLKVNNAHHEDYKVDLDAGEYES